MAQTVLLKRSSVAGNVPDSSDLSLGEIAVNTADGAVYIKKGNNDIVAVADNDILHIDTTNSRVGIGTTSPTGTFHVVGSNAIIDTADGSGLTINRPGNSAHMHLFPAYSSVPTIMGQGAGGLHLGYDSSTAGIRIDTSNNVGIGTTSPSFKLHVDSGTTDIAGYFKSSDNKAAILVADDDTNTYVSAENSKSSIGANPGIHANNLNITSTGSVGIGTTSPALQSGGTGIHVNGTSYSEIKFTNSTTGTASTDGTALVTVGTNFTINNRENGYFSLNTNNSERLRVDSSGNFLVGKTASDFTVAGHEMKPSSFAAFTRNGGSPLIVNRLSSDGAIIEFYKGTSSVGSIGTNNDDLLIYSTATGHKGLRFAGGEILPVSNVGALEDNTTDLGSTAYRFKNLQLSGTAYAQYFGSSADTNTLIQFAGSDDIRFRAGGTEQMRINTTGVGIGTTSPDLKLDVSHGTTTEYVATFQNTADNLELKIGTTTGALLNIQGQVISSSAAYNIGLQADGGNVGIGTATPDTTLDVTSDGVQGIILNQDTGNSSASGRIFFKSTQRTNTILNVSGNLEFRTGATIGSSSGTVRMTIVGSSGAIKFNNAYTFPTADGSANQVLQTDGSGNLSFGTAAGGGVSISNNVNNRVLTGDGTNANAEANLTFDGSTLGVTGNISSGAITSSGNITTTSGLFQATKGNQKVRQYEVGSSAGTQTFLLGKIENGGNADGGVTGTVKAAYDYGETVNNCNIHFTFAQRSGTARGHWWYENTDDDAGTDVVSVKLVDDGAGGMFVWLYVGDYVHCFVEAVWRQCSSVTNSGTLSAGTITTGTTLFDTANDPTSEHHIGRLYAHNDIYVLDNKKVYYGNSNDLQIYHDGTGSLIRNYTGDLYIQNEQDDGDIYFKSDNASGGTTTYLMLDGGQAQTRFLRNAKWEDNTNALFGTNDDLQLFHNGSASYISQQGAGDLVIRTTTDNGNIVFQSDDGSGGLATYFALDGGVGYTTAQKDIRMLDGVSLRVGTGGDARFMHNGTNSLIENDTGDLYIRNNANDKDIIFQSEDGSGGVTTYFTVDGSARDVVFNKDIKLNDNVKAIFGTGSDLEIYHDGSNSIINDNGTGTLRIQTGGTNQWEFNGVNFKGNDGRKIILGDSSDLQIYHDGSNSYVVEQGTGELRLNSDNAVRIRKHDNETMALFTANGAVTLYYDNTAKLATTSTGVEITGNLDSPQISINDYISHNGDSNTYLGFSAADTFELVTGGTQKITADANAAYLRYQGSAKLSTAADGIILTSSDATNAAGPVIDFNRDSASPADADYLGQLKFRGENDADQDVVYAKITAKAADVSDGTEDGAIEFTVKKAGSNNINARLSANNLDLINGTGLSVAGNATITGNLTVNGSTTTISTATLDVEDKNITLNKGSGDTSGSADGAGITIQDAVDASTDATLTWNASTDSFNTSHSFNVIGNISLTNDLVYNANTNFDIKNPFASQNITFHTTPSGGSVTERVRIRHDGYVGIGTTSPADKLDVHGNIRAERLIADGSGGMLRKQADSWSSGAQTHDILYNGWTSSTGDYTYLKAAGNGTSGHGIIQVGDLGTWIGQTDSEQGGLADSNTAPIDDVFAFFRSDKSYIKGSLGIGTNNPSYKLHITETTTNAGAAFFEDGTSWLRVVPSLGGGGFNPMSVAGDIGLIFSSDDDSSTDSGTLGLLIAPHSNNAGGIKICEDGDVGIGDTSPQDYLEINGSGKGLGGLTISNSTHNHAALSFARSSTATARIFITEPAATHTSQMYFQTSDASGSTPNLVTAMSIDENQNVGIGTTSPGAALHIGNAGHLLFERGGEVRSKDTSGNIKTIARIDSSNRLQYGWSGNGGVLFMGGGSYTERMRIHTNGNIAINQTTAPHTLTVRGTISRVNSTGIQVVNLQTNNDAGQIAINNSGGTQKVKFDSAGDSYFNGGDLGIGTTSPSQILDVVGDLPSIRVGNDNATYRYAAIELGTAGGNWYISNGASKTTSNSDLYISRATDGTDHRFKFGRNDYALSIYDNADAVKVYLHADGNSYFNGGSLGIGTTSPASKFQVEEYGIDTTSTSSSATTQIAIHSFAAATFRSARFTVQVTNSTDSTYHTTELLLVHDGTTANITEFGEIHTGSAVEATFDADISSGNVRLLATPASTDTMAFKVVCHSITT